MFDKTINSCEKLYKCIEKLETLKFPDTSDEDIISKIIETLQQPRIEENKKIGFITEQLSLVFKKPTRHRYSQSFLMWVTLLEWISPACHDQMLKMHIS